MLNIYQEITISIPIDTQAEEDIADTILTVVHPGLKKLFGTEDIYIRNRKMAFIQRIEEDEQAMMQVINPYVQWALDSGMTPIPLGKEQCRLGEQRCIREQHIVGSKRQNLIRKACLSIVNGVHPYIDRILNEVHRLVHLGYIHDEAIKNMKYQYIDELVTTINEYNDTLALWIKMKQGTSSLNIETFKLNELFELLKKGSRVFEME